MPIKRIRGLSDYFTPLDGCPRCGYAYERELGYFLLSIWAINYGGGSLLGISIYCYLEYFYHLSLPKLLVCVISPVVISLKTISRCSSSENSLYGTFA